MAINGFKAIIFDMDGLLVDSESVWFDAEKEMIESYGFEYTDEVRDQIVGMRMDEFLAKLNQIYKFGKTVDELNAELLDRMLTIIPERVVAQAGAKELVGFVGKHDIPRAIASSSPMSIIDMTIGAQGWDDVFVRRFSADDDANGKPAPDVYLRAVRELGYEPHECLALEDSPNGSRAAVAAGLTCYAVPDVFHTDPSAFKDITPHVFNDLHEVLALLKG